MKLRLLGVALVAALSFSALPALASGLFPQLPASTSPGTAPANAISQDTSPGAAITGQECIPADTGLTNGQNPATECISPSQLTNWQLGHNLYSTIPIGSVAYGSLGTNTTPVAGTVAVPTDSGTTVQYVDVSGGKLYFSSVRQGSGPAQVSAPTFVSAAAAGSTSLNLALTNAKSALGVPLTATAGSPSGAVGVSRTAGTSLQLAGEATSGNTKTNAAFFEANLPAGYIGGHDVTLDVNASISGTGTLTAASCLMTPTVYSEGVNGAETAVTVGAAKQIVAAGSTLSFVITGTNLTPGQRLGIGLSMAIVSSSGANTGLINSAALRSS